MTLAQCEHMRLTLRPDEQEECEALKRSASSAPRTVAPVAKPTTEPIPTATATITTTTAGTIGADDAVARTLYLDGIKLMEDGKTSEACAKLAESFRIRENLNALFYLAECQEHEGKVASAWANYLRAGSMAKAIGDTGKSTEAKARGDKLEPRLPKLTIKVLDDSPDLIIHRGAMLIGRAQWNSAIPVDPGEFDVIAEAPRKKPYRARIEIKAGGVATVVVTKLAPE